MRYAGKIIELRSKIESGIICKVIIKVYPITNKYITVNLSINSY